MDLQNLRREYFLPGAIVLAGIIISLALYAVRTDESPKLGAGSPELVRPVSPEDRILGNPQAPVKLVEYADIDSEYSKEFQATLQQVMSEYAAGGKVAWVYRHFPLLDQHAASASHAEAAECAAFLGTSDTFWRFIDALQAAAPGESQFPVSGYTAAAESLGIPVPEFETCLQNGRFTKKVYDDSTNALQAGAEGAPYTILLVEGQKPVGIQGSLPYEDLKRVIDEAIAKVK
ncbi:MAG TPA: thioredoxin domain-containing protein [Candidatus Paceibacterota bacterium]|nr:thioredoxin domain-containing protein [Candidatus Paceibacterota bacterium]